MPTASPLPVDPQMHPYFATPTNTEVSSSRGRKRVKRDRTKLYRENIRSQDKIEELEKKVRKYKKRLHRKSKKDCNSKDENNSKKYKQKINFYLMAYRFFEQYNFRKISWNFF